MAVVTAEERAAAASVTNVPAQPRVGRDPAPRRRAAEGHHVRLAADHRRARARRPTTSCCWRGSAAGRRAGAPPTSAGAIRPATLDCGPSQEVRHATPAPGPEGRVERPDRHDHVRPAVRAGSRPGRRSRHRRPARPATGGRCSRSCPTCSSTAVDGFGLYQSPKRLLDPQLRELGQTRVGWARGSQFVFSQHCKSCRAIGMSEAEDRGDPGVDRRRRASTPTERARARLHRRARLRRRPGGRRRVRRSCGRTSTTRRSSSSPTSPSLYEMHATMSRALRMEFDDRRRAHRRGDRSRRRVRARRRSEHQPAG